MKSLILPLVIFYSALFTFQGELSAYPNYITYGYDSCLNCHYNPHGNGPLTDYGRALGSAEIASHFFYGENADKDWIADQSGFFGKPYEQDWLRPSLSYRGLYLLRNADKPGERKEDWINMNASLSVVAKFLKRDKLIVAFEMGYAPKPRSQGPDSDLEEYRTREHYIGYRIDRRWGVYAGLMDKVFGLRVPDHTAYSRSITGLNQNDQTHGLVLHYGGKDFEFGVQPFVGNLVQDKELRQKGLTAMGEISGGKRARYGASILASESEYSKMHMLSTHGRFGFGQISSFLFEVGQVNKTKKNDDALTSSRYAFTQTHLGIDQGLWGLVTLEGLVPDTSKEALNLRFGPGLQYFPMPRLELRTDAYLTARMAKDTDTATSLDLTAQIHLWL
jgi:hypothetical protein